MCQGINFPPNTWIRATSTSNFSFLQSNFNGSNTDGSSTMAYSNSFFESLRIFSDSSRKQILREIVLFYYEIVCCVYSLESSHRGDSNEYTQHTIILLKIENTSINYRHLLPDLAPWLNLIGSNYPSLEQISMVPKMFEPLKFDCNSLAHTVNNTLPLNSAVST